MLLLCAALCVLLLALIPRFRRRFPYSFRYGLLSFVAAVMVVMLSFVVDTVVLASRYDAQGMRSQRQVEQRKRLQPVPVQSDKQNPAFQPSR